MILPQENLEQIATNILEIVIELDYYEYKDYAHDDGGDHQEIINEISSNPKSIKEWLKDIVTEIDDERFNNPTPEDIILFKKLDQAIDDINMVISESEKEKDKMKETRDEAINNIQEEMNQHDETVNVVGNITSDPKITERTNKDGEAFEVANYSVLVASPKGEPAYDPPKYVDFQATGDKVSEVVKNLKPGDFIRVFGKEKEYTTKEGNTKKYVQVLKTTLLSRSKDREGPTQEKQNDTKLVTGNLTNDVSVTERTNKDGDIFKVATFGLAENKNDESSFYSCSVGEAHLKDVEQWKTGDFVSIKGKVSTYTNKEGKEQTHIRVFEAKLLKQKEQKKSIINAIDQKKNEISQQSKVTKEPTKDKDNARE